MWGLETKSGSIQFHLESMGQDSCLMVTLMIFLIFHGHLLLNRSGYQLSWAFCPQILIVRYYLDSPLKSMQILKIVQICVPPRSFLGVISLVEQIFDVLHCLTVEQEWLSLWMWTHFLCLVMSELWCRLQVVDRSACIWTGPHHYLTSLIGCADLVPFQMAERHA